jgi:hypothetical protein
MKRVPRAKTRNAYHKANFFNRKSRKPRGWHQATSREAEDLRDLVRPEGRVHLVGESPTRVMVGWPGSWQAVRLGNWPDRSPATKAALGGRANRRAVTCVKPEQASKGKLWTPTRPKRGEGSTVWGSSRQTHPNRSTGVVGTARRDRGTRKRGRSTCDEGSGLNGAAMRRSVWKSERVVVPLKPGNAGGGKAPDFWCVFEADEVR